MSIFISTLSKDNFKQEFIKTLAEVSEFRLLNASRIWRGRSVQALFSRVRKCWSMHKVGGAFLCPTNGFLLLHESLPYSFTHEVVPFLWDCWPGSWAKLLRSLDILHVRLCFVTSKQVFDMLKAKRPNMKTVYVPEAVNSVKFCKGKDLAKRSIDVFEVGRKNERYHRVLSEAFRRGKATRNYVDGYVEDYCQTLSNTKITISFPRCDTNPEMAGKIETLTERYWEAMFSRCLIIGRAPHELIDLIGYNPVVEVDWSNPQEQLKYILEHISDYQNLADRNYGTAMMYGDWHVRMPGIIKEIETLISDIK